MAYEKTVWENGVTPLNADNMNKIEDELEELDTSAVKISPTATAGQVPMSDGAGGITWGTIQAGNPVSQFYGRGDRFEEGN